jgi:hypothetical protein
MGKNYIRLVESPTGTLDDRSSMIDHRYSYRRASTGSSRAARLAG